MNSPKANVGVSIPQPYHAPEHLAWRLASVNPEMPPGWFLLDGKQVVTIVRALQHLCRPTEGAR